ncbi:DUF5123 domain-containing protein [Flavobacterium aquidurense]|uniref:Fibronectin, type III domain-containing protein n=1 Tax=Flavobacterium aquidurense TaxID=362413 RepID=A0A0Q0W4Z9_9FLAO|nr:DUF5123 domain-containing protein [Flavobacterium aquidurense]KQB41696.1 Fibronectin, type III domain-containing protein [Flavobacterium aquidurense]
MMKTKYILKGLIATLVLAFAISSCESYNEELLDGIGNSREFSPIALTAKVKTQTFVELNWTVNPEADHYTVEFSADDPDFKVIYKTLQVTASQLPLTVQLEGETTYSIRVKAITTGLEDSKWSVVTATTLSEQLFVPVQPVDIEAKQVTLRWTPNSNVTQITLAPGGVTHTITPAEKTAGVAIVTGLTAETEYTATLLNGAKKRGVITFTTGIDIGTGILVKPEDDLNAKINEAAAGAILVLMPGDYTIYKGDIALNKSITIRGLRPDNKPKLHVKFTLNAGTGNLSLIDLDLDGTGVGDFSFITINTAAATYGDILISGSYVHDYLRALIYGSMNSAKVASFTVDNSIIKNVSTNLQAETIDFRNTYVASIVLKNSTFDTCSVGREFIRVDNAGLTGTGLTSNVLVDSCTLYNISNTVAAKRILYIRFASNTSTVKNTIIAGTTAIYSNQNGTTTPTTPPTFATNNYFNASLLYTVGAAAITVDKSTTFTTLDPQFVGAATGNFTIKNQTLIDNKVGDPRWRQ